MPSEWRKTPGYVRRVAAIVRDVALAAQALHDREIVHRDIKPRNILLSQDGRRAVLVDLGVAKLATDTNGGVTRTREFVGSLRYASPEQVLDSGQVDHRSDIYSLGATLWELLTLRPIYGIGPEVNDPQAMLRIEVEEPQPVRKFNRAAPADLQAVAQKCLEKNPQRRYSSAAAVADDLARFLDGQPVEARPVRAVSRIARRWRRRPLVPSLVLAMALMVMALLGALLPWPSPESNTIRVGIKPWIGFSPLVVAEQLKLCEGAELKLVPVRNSTDVRQRVFAREIEAAPYLVDTHALARASRTPTAIVLQLDTSLTADAVIARQGINQFSDLRGKTVAYMHQEAPHFLLLSLCEKFHLETEEFKHETAETAQEAVDLFIAGKADAVVTYDPFMRQALRVAGAKRIASAADDPGAIIDILTVREDFLQSERPKVKALIAAWFKALDLLERGDPRAMQIACQFLGTARSAISPKQYREMAQGMRYGGMAENLAFFRKNGAGGNEFRSRFEAAQRRWRRHHQLGHVTDPRDGDASDVFLEMYGP